jgi:hypothetical protein
VFNIKVSGMAGAAALILSFLVGFLSGAGLAIALLRALIFGAAFFILAAGIYIAVSFFLPELLEEGEAGQPGEEAPGSKVDIMVEDGENAPASGIAPEGEGSLDGLGNISDLVGGPSSLHEDPETFREKALGLDQKEEDRYTKKGVEENSSKSGAAPQTAAIPRGPAVPDASDAVDVLPDLDTMASAFVPPSRDEGEEAESSPVKRPSPGNKPQNMRGDFNPKELASAIQTILKRD